MKRLDKNIVLGTWAWGDTLVTIMMKITLKQYLMKRINKD